jgi:RimJ/RimL family protein N-acetyltransferase
MIYGDNIRLRAPTRSDIPTFVSWFNDPEVTAGLLMTFPLSIEDEESWFNNMQQTPIEEHPLVIDVLKGNNWITIGNSSFHKIDWRNRVAEIGIVIGEKAYWNSGYGTQAMYLLVQHGFGMLNLNRIFLHVFANNPRAIRCYEKVGFVHEGCLRQNVYKNGMYVDVIVMSILRSEWNQINKKN